MTRLSNNPPALTVAEPPRTANLPPSPTATASPATTRSGRGTLRYAHPDERMDALRLVLGQSGRPAPDERIADFLRIALERGFDLERLSLLTGTPSRPLDTPQLHWAVLPILNPGRTALLLTPSTVEPEQVPEAADLVTWVTEGLENIHLSQALVDPTDPYAAEPLIAAGYRRLTTLHYLQRDIKPKHITRATPLPGGMSELHYSAETHSVFRAAIARSYEQSLDCPALSGMRSLDDVIADHRVAGRFDPSIWTVILEGDRPAAVLLLAEQPLEPTLELVYLGVSPEYRRRGLAQACLRRAVETACRKMCERLTLAVDEQNEPALRLYRSMGLRKVHERLAMVKDLRSR